MNVVSFSQNILLYILCSPFFLWWCEIKCLHDEMKWGEWHGHFDVVLGYYWPFDDKSEGKESVSGLQLTTVTEIMEN